MKTYTPLPAVDEVKELEEEIEEAKLGMLSRREAKIAQLTNIENSPFKDKPKEEEIKKRSRVALSNLEKKFVFYCRKFNTIQQKANLFRRLKSSLENVNYIEKCLESNEKIDVHRWKYNRLPHEMMLLKMAYRTNRYKEDKERFEIEKENVLLTIYGFKIVYLQRMIDRLRKELVDKKINITLEVPHERVFVKNKKIFIEKIEEVKRKEYSTVRIQDLPMGELPAEERGTRQLIGV